MATSCLYIIRLYSDSNSSRRELDSRQNPWISRENDFWLKMVEKSKMSSQRGRSKSPKKPLSKGTKKKSKSKSKARSKSKKKAEKPKIDINS